MKNVDKVLKSIKEECGKQKAIAAISCLEKIARDADITPGKLAIYLSQLNEMGLIEYSVADRYIYLTRAGMERSVEGDHKPMPS